MAHLWKRGGSEPQTASGRWMICSKIHVVVCLFNFHISKAQENLGTRKLAEYTRKQKTWAKHNHSWNLLLSTLAFWSHFGHPMYVTNVLNPAVLISIINQLTP